MNSKWKFPLVFSLITVSFAAVVDIDDGSIEGTVLTSRLGNSYDAFLGIPYAEPPVNDLRFQPPQAVKPWNGVLNATTYGPVCMQHLLGNQQSEDCLHLNVFTRNLGNSELKPTIVYIHGGAWIEGSGVDSSSVMMMDRDIVFVTINYRLGALGFLATGTKDAYGNMALKDQTLALKWVKKNIEKFGGDSNKITIAGLSAGSFSVTAQVVSPMARDLFVGAIAMSGGITWKAKFPTDYLSTARKLAEKLQCEVDDVAAMVECLKTVPASEIVADDLSDYPECTLLTWKPVVEPDLGQERFFTEQPEETISKGNFSKVPVMIGVTTDEFIFPVLGFLNNSQLLEKLNENFDEFAPVCFSYDADPELSKAMRNLYFPLEKIDVRSFNGLHNFFADSMIGYGVHRFAHLLSNFTSVYYYKFSFVGERSFFLYPRNKPYGVHHGDDTVYSIPYLSDVSIIQPDDPENFMVERMTRIYAQFALNGNPNNKTDEYLSEMNWPELTTDTEYYLDIGTHLIEKNGLFLERYTVWEGASTSGKSATTGSFLMFGLTIFLISLK